jgi:chromosome segregation ATPase
MPVPFREQQQKAQRPKQMRQLPRAPLDLPGNADIEKCLEKLEDCEQRVKRWAVRAAQYRIELDKVQQEVQSARKTATQAEARANREEQELVKAVKSIALLEERLGELEEMRKSLKQVNQRAQAAERRFAQEVQKSQKQRAQRSSVFIAQDQLEARLAQLNQQNAQLTSIRQKLQLQRAEDRRQLKDYEDGYVPRDELHGLQRKYDEVHAELRHNQEIVERLQVTVTDLFNIIEASGESSLISDAHRALMGTR